ncbi:hypothetical protein [Echinicola vietnamensis]|uniref:Uncharacterized protein n=1 Tax=Echinicola vietnamensis (strain DSM 17526 / LMG 23754 / KMM 6221) TaxID=926556 RepID=L0FSV9_ECHVK|nr:hypothetical protein [Echinicola vietnamensis]AGA76382.1 hypothetical protein Echvi_0085 [Echinicola vietnamensis DSM 17526]
MSEEEFEMMDELYFVQPFTYLKEVLNWDDEVLLTTLQGLYHRGLIKCLSEPDEEVFGDAKIMDDGKSYYYLATKKGLMEHNTL